MMRYVSPDMHIFGGGPRGGQAGVALPGCFFLAAVVIHKTRAAAFDQLAVDRHGGDTPADAKYGLVAQGLVAGGRNRLRLA